MLCLRKALVFVSLQAHRTRVASLRESTREGPLLQIEAYALLTQGGHFVLLKIQSKL